MILDGEHLNLLYIDKDIKAGGLRSTSMGDHHLSLQGQAGWATFRKLALSILCTPWQAGNSKDELTCSQGIGD